MDAFRTTFLNFTQDGPMLLLKAVISHGTSQRPAPSPASAVFSAASWQWLVGNRTTPQRPQPKHRNALG